MSLTTPTTASTELCPDTAAVETQPRRAWQTPRVITGLEGSEIAAAEGIEDLLGHHFFAIS